MNEHHRLGASLNQRLNDLPSISPEHYLAAGRAAACRRRYRRGGLIAAAAAAAVIVAGSLAPSLNIGAQEAHETPAAAVTTRTPVRASSLSELRVESGLGAINAFSTDEVPSSAMEFRNHGPAAIAPDGRLWIAPEATVLRSIADPLGQVPGMRSYAVESRGWTSADGTLGGDEPVWSFVYQDDDRSGTSGTVDTPGRWTVDFAVWADDYRASVLDQPRFAETLASFAAEGADELVAGTDATLLAQKSDAAIGDRPRRARQSVAEVRVGGQIWFVLAVGKRTGGADYYEAYDEASSGATDLDGFLRFLADGAP